ncbi:MAG: ABC transporter ATP-binding protein [Firmicutes bacterium]|nr:ABC transporter ATP-binding protein [Bacillota bacterium]
MGTYVLETKDLTKRYRKIVAVNKVNMHIRKGDIYGFVGKNGAGKTTLIRVITGVAEKTSGFYYLFGETNPQNFVRSRAKMAAVVENPAIYLNLNAYENLKAQCVLLGIIDHVDDVINKVMDKVGLPALLQNRKLIAKNYSMGMKQRLGIAMALISNPEFLVLDEPTNGLDPEGIKSMRLLLQKINFEDHVTILISSHILGELSKLATTYGFIDKGRLIEEISAEELERRSQKGVILSIKDTSKVPEILGTLGITTFELLPTGVRIFGEIKITEVIVAFGAAGIVVTNIHEQNQDLEEYFMNLIGGK